MQRAALIVAAAGLTALFAWLTLSDPAPVAPELPISEPPEERAERIEIPPVIETEPAGPHIPAGPSEPALPDADAKPGEEKSAEKQWKITTGQVVDQEGRPVAGVTVVARCRTNLAGGPPLMFFDGVTNGEGVFTIKGSSEAERLWIDSLRYVEVEPGRPLPPPGEAIVIVVRPTLAGTGVLLADPDGKSVQTTASVKLSIEARGWTQIMMADTDRRDGRFRFTLDHARYRDETARFEVLVTAEGYEDRSVPDLTLEDLLPDAKLEIRLTPAPRVEPGKLSGRVLYDTGDPFVGPLTLSFTREGKAGQVFSIDTNEKGEFLLTKLAAGEYVLRTAPHGESTLRETGKTLVIPPGGEATTEFTLIRGGDISLDVTGPGGNEVKGVSIRIIAQDGTPEPWRAVPNGRGVLQDLAPGPVRMEVTAPGHQTETRTVTVVKDRKVPAEIRLQEER